MLRTAAVGATALLLAATGSCTGGDKAPPQTAGAQGWTAQQTSDWYGGKQGSRLMPYSWFKALEQPNSDQPFAAPAFMMTFRFLARPDQPLPVGFAVDDNDDGALTVSKLRWFEGQGPKEPWVGLNCSACHTGEIAFGNKPRMRIEGAPSLVDFQMFTDALDAALVQTRDDPAKWERFAKAVLAGKDTPANRALLKAEFAKHLGWQMKVAAVDKTTIRYGYGRLDAVGRIFNKVALYAQPGGTPIVNPPDAPVSYPFLWDIWRQDKLQWNGIAQSRRINLPQGRFFDYGAMGRNAGEVIGVFGDVDTTPGPMAKGFHSSIWADNLDRLEVQLRALKAPVWPAEYFPLTAEEKAVADRRREAGAALFANRGCKGCHGIFGPEVTKYQVTMVPLRASPRDRTDIWMACNAFTYNARSGNLTKVPEDFIKGRELGATEPTGTLLATMVKGSLVGKKGELVHQLANTFLGINRRPVAPPQDVTTEEDRIRAREQRCITEPNDLLAYKGRPLDGIWATAPYLHNGSVPTLYDLLLPPEKRPTSFAMGTRQFDPVKVGYVTAASAPGNSFPFRTEVRGNSNMGHDYGVGSLTEEERWSLLEYMKSL